MVYCCTVGTFDQVESHSDNLLYLYQFLHGTWDDSEMHKVTAQLNGDKVG